MIEVVHMENNYELVIGLEIHIELKTKSKIFCSCSTEFGGEPNTRCCPVCMGYPGTMPTLNDKVLDLGIRAGISLNSEISNKSCMDRKNYFYPDLPKGYQITQYDKPLCKNGYVDIGDKKIRIERIHIEEDAGKLTYDENNNIYCEFNRCGIPLIEIVTKADITSSDEAVRFLKKLKEIMIYSEVSDCHMEKGELRCDVNVSVRKKGEISYGTRVEIKNVNSFQFIKKAIDYEFKRQVNEIEEGNKIVCETRGFDSVKGKTYTMRIKETSDDYRYFREPDIPEIYISNDRIENIRNKMTDSADIRRNRYINEFNLKLSEADLLLNSKEIADYFEECVKLTKRYDVVYKLLTGEIFRLLNGDNNIKISSKSLAKLSEYVYNGKVNVQTAIKVINILWNNSSKPVDDILNENNMWQINDESILSKIIKDVLYKNGEIVEQVKSGNEKALKVLMGKAVKETNGYGNPVTINKLLSNMINIYKKG